MCYFWFLLTVIDAVFALESAFHISLSAQRRTLRVGKSSVFEPTGDALPSSTARDALLTPNNCTQSRGCCRQLRRHLAAINCKCRPAEPALDCRCSYPGDDGGEIVFPKPWMTIQQFWDTGAFLLEETIHWRAFHDMADVRCSTQARQCEKALQAVEERSLVYAHLLSLRVLVAALPRLPQFFLVTHRQDANIWPQEPWFGQVIGALLASDRILHWFALNVGMPHPMLLPLPLGLNLRQVVALRNTSRHKAPAAAAAALRLAHANFPTNDQPWLCTPQAKANPSAGKCFRDAIMAKLVNNGVIEAKISKRQAPSQYFDDMLQFKFVISPPGHGWDTYRNWEALHLGRIPVMQHGPLDPMFRDLPVLQTDADWRDITPAFLQAQWDAMQERKYDFGKLTLQ
eukprot:EG_transcript_14363